MITFAPKFKNENKKSNCKSENRILLCIGHLN